MRAANPTFEQKRFASQLQGAWRADCHFVTPLYEAVFHRSLPGLKKRLEDAITSITVAKCRKFNGNPHIDRPQP